MTSRPTAMLTRAQELARSADVALDPTELGSARYTRHSFARSCLRAAVAQGWKVDCPRWELDAEGQGTAVFRIDIAAYTFHFVVFSTIVPEAQRTDRVIATSWDVKAALVTGEVDDQRIAELRAQVPLQERGRADDQTLIWTRANRSGRFFDYVVSRLASGSQPEAEAMGDSAYVLRSTAFYSNGKFGLADFERFATDHPLRLPYRAHMLAAWLLREFSCRLVEHCAAERDPRAVRLRGGWQRFFGLGNATGLGMVPYVVNHPQVLDAWCAARELPLAYSLGQTVSPGDPKVARVAELLDRARVYFGERNDLATAPFLPYPEIAAHLDQLAEYVAEYRCTGTILGNPVSVAWQTLHDAAGELGLECRGVLDSIIVEVHPELDDDVDQLLRCDQTQAVQGGRTCAQLLVALQHGYEWVRSFDFTDPTQQSFFWYSSADNEEPRRGRRGQDSGEDVEHPIDVARAVTRLWDDLIGCPPEHSVAEFLLGHPWHRGAVARVQAVSDHPYAECRTNLLAEDFLPLNIQRFQLAQYGMESYSPQSTDWLRVVLYSGAPRTDDVAVGIDDDWMFTCKPVKDTP